MEVTDKSRIIEAIQKTDDERILFAIKRLLLIEEEEIPEWHKEVLHERLKTIEEGNAKFYPWEEVKDKIFGK